LNPAGPAACEAPCAEAGPARSDAEYIALLRQRGYAHADIQDFPDGFIVEGDLFIPKTDLDKPLPAGKVSQRQAGSAITASKTNWIRVQVHPSLAAWKSDVMQAVNMWNAVQSGIRMIPVASGGDILVAADTASALPASRRNLASNTCGMSGFPSGGDPYGFVSINVDQSYVAGDERERIDVIAHEIGHAIGFAHSNSDDGTLIPGTPDTDKSLMNGGQCGEHDDNLSDWDRKALLIKYPKDVPLSGMKIKDGDFKDDLVFWRPESGYWHVKKSSSGFASEIDYQWGLQGDVPLAKCDFDGDGFSDLVTWRPSTGTWAIAFSASGYTTTAHYQWGQRGDIPLGGMDIDHDRKTDLVVWRWTEGKFKVLKSSSNFTAFSEYAWGGYGDIPMADTDLDRDGYADLVFWRPDNGAWYYKSSASNFGLTYGIQWGTLGDIPVPGTDYDGDLKDDITVYRPLTGQWQVLTSATNYAQYRSYQFGAAGDIPLPEADLDGDARKDLAFWRPTTGTWYVRTAASGFATGPTWQFGR
jgi:hypothetical protein